MQQELGDSGVSRTQVWESIQLLSDLGMVRRIETSGDRAVWYERVEDSPGWDLVRAAVRLYDAVGSLERDD